VGGAKVIKRTGFYNQKSNWLKSLTIEKVKHLTQKKATRNPRHTHQ